MFYILSGLFDKLKLIITFAPKSMTDSEKHYFYSFVGRQVKLFRVELNLTQDALAKLVGKSRVTIANIEVGKQYPPLHLIIDLARALKTDIGSLVDEDRWMKNNILSIKEEDINQIKKKDQQKIQSFFDKLDKLRDLKK